MPFACQTDYLARCLSSENKLQLSDICIGLDRIMRCALTCTATSSLIHCGLFLYSLSPNRESCWWHSHVIQIQLLRRRRRLCAFCHSTMESPSTSSAGRELLRVPHFDRRLWTWAISDSPVLATSGRSRLFLSLSLALFLLQSSGDGGKQYKQRTTQK